MTSVGTCFLIAKLVGNSLGQNVSEVLYLWDQLIMASLANTEFSRWL